MKIFQLIKIPRFVRIDVFYFKPSSLLTATSKSWKKQAEANQSLIWAINLAKVQSCFNIVVGTQS
jgi:hypothetical protein